MLACMCRKYSYMDTMKKGELEDELKRAKERIAELRDEVDDQRATIRELDTHLKEGDEYLENFITTFGMQLHQRDDRTSYWTWTDSGYATDLDELDDKHRKLIRKYNDLCDDFNRRFVPLNIGRPLAAGKGQKEAVLKLRADGSSLREIAQETGLGVRTVRTIVDQKNGTDRTTRKHREKAYEREKAIGKNTGKMTRALLPKRITAHLEKSRELLKIK